MRKNKPLILIIVLLLGIGGFLIAWGRFVADPSLQTWANTNVQCIDGHHNLAQHIHPNLIITVDGEPEPLPANTGIRPGCMAEIHTHGAGSRLHVETTTASRMDQLTLADFFDVWGQPFDRSGYDYELLIGNNPVDRPENVFFEGLDGELIILNYTSNESSTASTTTQRTSTSTEIDTTSIEMDAEHSDIHEER